VQARFEADKALIFTGQDRVVGYHCDFAPYNVLLSPDRVSVIDFEGLQEGLIYEDICYFIGMIDSLPAYHLDARMAERIKDCFLQGYTRHRSVDQAQLNAFMLVAMLKIVARGPLLDGRVRGWVERGRRMARRRRHTAWFEEYLTS
jgi:Ser/Thr protein kinase RdoA (MazF antagonist)